MQDTQLFQTNEKTITTADFRDAIRAIGARENDTLFVHADISVFGKLAPNLDRNSLSLNLIDSCENAQSGTTLILPTFTYAFCKSGIFDIENSPSEVGMLTEFFRREPGVARSRHPIFSVAARGPKTTKMTKVDLDSFGKHSFFANLHSENGLVVFLGASFERATFVHYIEQIHGVPYRFVKTFPGVIRELASETPCAATFLVRYLDQDVVTYLARLEDKLRADGFLKEASVGAGKILAVRAQDMFNTGMNLLDEDINAFLKQPPQQISQS